MLNDIKNPMDLKELEFDELNSLCEEIRGRICSVVSENGGHLASNLGIVETTVALHRVFDLPRDKIIFDVGHQCYAHKILTGRNDDFESLRKCGGISGFTNRFESEYDAFTAGHSGSSVSSALGLAQTNKILCNDSHVVAVVGDGSFTNGMIYEALNNCCDKKLKLTIVLNDNEMSISGNVGNMARYLSKLRTSKSYFKFKHGLRHYLMKIPFAGKKLYDCSVSVKNFFKRVFLADSGFFTSLGIKYLGPVDGHNIEKLEDVFREAKCNEGCTLVLIKTKKGKGYNFAEEMPCNYHAVSKFDLSCGVEPKECANFSSVFGDYMCNKALQDDKIVSLTAAMCDGTGLCDFKGKFTERFFDVGIAEEHEITFAAGLSAGGMKPVCAVYSTFAQRIYDQVMHDVSVQGLPLVLAFDRAGFVPDDGITHQGIFDVSMFSSVPGCNIYSPETYEELEKSFDKALEEKGVSIVRYPKGSETQYDRSKFVTSPDGNCSVYGSLNSQITVFTYGRITAEAYGAAKELEKQYSIKLVKLIHIYPFDEGFVLRACEGSKLVYILEEGIKSGGIGEKITSCLCGKFSGKAAIRAVENVHAYHAETRQLFEGFGMDKNSIVNEINNLMKEEINHD